MPREAPPVILDQYGRPYRREAEPARRSGYDVAKTTPENKKHWAEADGLAPVSQLTPSVRRTLRNRCRYEVLNNCYLAGMVRTLVADTVGTGARLEMDTGDAKLDANVESLWRVWAAATDWPLNSRILCGVRYVAGECFGLFRDSERLDRLGLPVTLDVRLIEPDQVTDGWAGVMNPTGDDGIVCDDEGEVTAYKVLRRHPGDNRAFSASLQPDTIDARNVVHWFVPERPAQLRGVTPLAACLPIAAQLRRFTQAVLAAAEFAASIAGVLESDMAADAAAPAVTEDRYYDVIEVVRGMLLTLPAGVKANPFKSEQPTTNYEMFLTNKLRELGRPINMPFGKVAGDHSRYNYSSGKMDDAPYWDERDVERQGLEAKFFDPVLYKWFDFAKLVIPALIPYEGQWWKLRHRWHYRARPVFDPVKDASGDELNLTNGSDTLTAIAERDGTTLEVLLDQRARERDMFVARNLPLPPWLAGAVAPNRTAEGQPTPQEATNAPA